MREQRRCEEINKKILFQVLILFKKVLLNFVDDFSVDLARRVLELERANTSLRKELEREKQKSDDLVEEVIFFTVNFLKTL